MASSYTPSIKRNRPRATEIAAQSSILFSPRSPSPPLLYSTVVHDPEGDVCLRSSDNVLFLVRQCQLQGASEVFSGLFEACTDEHTRNGKKPVIVVAECEKELEGFLVFLVSCSKRPKTMDLRTCMKYVSDVSLLVCLVW